ncbi:MAG: PulJ/GspJ family protein [Planctomycetota bacterium]|jgi:prepilin-type N-terminal cleavage/methylation domain-containing protein
MSPPRRATRAFTLLEVLVALSIMSLIMVTAYTTLNATLSARDQLDNEAKVARLGPEILDMIEHDLRRIWLMDIEGDRVFKGESRTIDGEPADSLSLLTTVDSSFVRRIGERDVPADLCETGYRLRRSDSLPDVMELWRRQSYHLDEEPLADGSYELVHDRIVAFQVRYRAELDKTADLISDWDSSVLHRLPALIEIEIALEAVPRTIDDFGRREAAGRTLSYRRSIPMPRDTDLAMRVHAIAPTFAAAGAGGPGGSNLGGEDGDTQVDGGPDGDASGNGGAGGNGGGGGDGGGDGNIDDFGKALGDALKGLGGGGG